MLFIRGATIYTPQKKIENGAILVVNGRISSIGEAGQITPPTEVQILDAEGMSLVPGFIDLQLNGGFGHDFTTSPETIWDVATELPQYGVTSFLPTIITSPLETVARGQKVLHNGNGNGKSGAVPLGLHVEGPFLNPKKKGAHNAKHLRTPDLGAISAWAPNQGVRLVTLAPELPGALEMAETLESRGVVVSAGHSMATYDEAIAGFNAGITYCTHLFNAMPPLHHRKPGLIGAALGDNRCTVGMIPDGIHLHPAVAQTIWAAKDNQKLTLVTDAMAALGMPPGRYQIGDKEVFVTENDARLKDGTLAGSILSMDQALRNLMAFTGCSLMEALPAITTTPASLLDIADQRGTLSPGSYADLVLLTPELEVAVTLVKGEVVYAVEGIEL
jgi:N-acetylglucosamine-6-phosphate deacetylase